MILTLAATKGGTGKTTTAAAVGGAANMGISIYDYAPRSKTAQDYRHLYDRIKGGF